MKSILHERRKSSILTAVISILIGIVLVAFPVDSVRWVCLTFGAVLLLGGAWYVISYFRGKSVMSAFQLDLVLGIILAILGLWLLLRPESVMAVVQYVFGAFLLLRGVIDLQGALALRSAGVQRWSPALVVSLLTIVLSVIILLDPFSSLAVLITLIGCVFVYNGIVELFLIFRLSRAFAAVEKAVDDAQPIEAEFTEAKEDDETNSET
jgi:uncharacterized membrane protein HdeD (DUF308 family)